MTACTFVDARRLDDARALAASVTGHSPSTALSVLVLHRGEPPVDPGREDFLVVSPSDLERDDVDDLGAAFDAVGLGRALLPSVLRALLAQADHVLVLDGVHRVTGPLDAVADAARDAGVLVDGDGQLIGIGRGPVANALLDEWDARVAARVGVAPPVGPDAVVFGGAPPWEVAASGPAPGRASGWEASTDAVDQGRPGGAQFGVNLVGYLEAELGVAEVARQLIGALDAQDVPVLPIGIVADGSRQGHAFGHVDAFANPFAVNLLCVNADQTPPVAERAGSRFFAGRRTVGLWWWETAEVPEYFERSFEVVDEVWACSGFVADTLRAVSPKPVVRIPMPVTLPAGVGADRERFGFGDEVVFLFIYDYNSVVERKNPLGLLDAYRRAFPEPAGARLVLKCINHERHPEAHARVLAAAGGRADVTVIDEYLDVGEKDALLASCDCYVSLHRSEGFGLTCAEAMLLGKPVIATSYSGSADYMAPDHSLPVDWALVPVGPGNEPYPADGVWAQPDLDQAAEHLRAVAADSKLRRRLGERARAFVEREHSPQATGAAMRARLEVAARLAIPASPYRPTTSVRALERVRDAIDVGPPPSSRPRWDPRRVIRALVLRLTAPRARHEREVHHRIVDAVERALDDSARAAAAMLADGQSDAWRALATSLREQRRLRAQLAVLGRGALDPDRAGPSTTVGRPSLRAYRDNS